MLRQVTVFRPTPRSQPYLNVTPHNIAHVVPPSTEAVLATPAPPRQSSAPGSAPVVIDDEDEDEEGVCLPPHHSWVTLTAILTIPG